MEEKERGGGGVLRETEDYCGSRTDYVEVSKEQISVDVALIYQAHDHRQNRDKYPISNYLPLAVPLAPSFQLTSALAQSLLHYTYQMRSQAP